VGWQTSFDLESWQLPVGIERIDTNSARAAVTRGPERGKLLGAFSRERLVKTQQARKGTAGDSDF
jgi:hypothetical protein